MKLNNISIKTKLQFLVILSALLMLSLGIFNVYLQQSQQLAERQNKLSAQVNAAVSLISYYRNQPTLTQDQAQSAANQALNAMRYDESNYFWITNSQNKLLLHTPLGPYLSAMI
jgi:methyl-accepting chemotaxis protein